MLLDAEPLADLVTGSSRAHVRQPISTRLRRRRCDDLHCLGVLELARQARDPTIDARTLTVETDLGVNRKRKVDRCGAFWQLDYITSRGEDEDFVLVEIELEELEELVGRLRIELQLENLTEPLQRTIELVGALS